MSLFPPIKNRSDCVTSTAILVAYRGARVLHQDISVGNIMLGEERSDGLKTTAILNDWDRAQRLNALSDDHRLVIRLSRLFIIMRIFLSLDTGDVGVHFNRLTPTG